MRPRHAFLPTLILLAGITVVFPDGVSLSAPSPLSTGGCLPKGEAKSIVDGFLTTAQILCVKAERNTNTEVVRTLCGIPDVPGLRELLVFLISEREAAARAGFRYAPGTPLASYALDAGRP